MREWVLEFFQGVSSFSGAFSQSIAGFGPQPLFLQQGAGSINGQGQVQPAQMHHSPQTKPRHYGIGERPTGKKKSPPHANTGSKPPQSAWPNNRCEPSQGRRPGADETARSLCSA